MNVPQPLTPPVASDLPIRILYMVLFGFVFSILCWILAVVCIFQLVIRLSNGHPGRELSRFGAALARYAAQIIEFLTFVTEILPYPFGKWPGET
jgi:hypothetical protein